MNIEGILESAILVKMPFLLTVYEGACDWQQREITTIPPIRPTGSLRIALGEEVLHGSARIEKCFAL